MKPFFCYIGSKKLLADRIIKHFPLHKTYVEPFIGGGAVYFKKPQSKKEVINDLDKKLIDDYKLIKKAPMELSSYEQNLNTIPKIKKFLMKKHITVSDKLLGSIIRRCNGFSGRYIGGTIVYKPSNPFTKIKHIQEYKNRLQNTIIKNDDYKKIIKQYDAPDTFFYLDPPYENSQGMYTESIIDYEEMANILLTVKGLFLISINDSPYIRKVFNKFNILKLAVIIGHRGKGIGQLGRTELIIKNY